MCYHEIGSPELRIDRKSGTLYGIVTCDGCGSEIQRFDTLLMGPLTISKYCCNPNLRGNSEHLGNPEINC